MKISKNKSYGQELLISSHQCIYATSLCAKQVLYKGL